MNNDTAHAQITTNLIAQLDADAPTRELLQAELGDAVRQLPNGALDAELIDVFVDRAQEVVRGIAKGAEVLGKVLALIGRRPTALVTATPARPALSLVPQRPAAD